MSFNFKSGGSWRTLNTGWVKVSGVWQQVQTAWVKVSGGWQKVFTNFSVTANKATVQGSGSGFTPCGNPGNTDSVTVTPAGGTAPYSYSWARVGAAASSGPYQANAPTSATTSFSDVNSSVCDADADPTETWRCTVTDDVGDTASVDVDVTLLWVDSS